MIPRMGGRPGEMKLDGLDLAQTPTSCSAPVAAVSNAHADPNRACEGQFGAANPRAFDDGVIAVCAASAKEPEVQLGRKVALMVCANCHVVAPDQTSKPILTPPAQSFKAGHY